MATPGIQDWAYDYLRFSSGEQEEGDSVRRQRSRRDDWLSRNPGVRLDKSLLLEDRGVSGFRGAHRKEAKHAMSQFLAHVESGRVAAGSFLLVENLDRLTRENPVDSLPWILNLIKKGIRIVQLSPSEVVYDSGMDEIRLVHMLLELARGHGESKRKSGTVGSAWAEKKRAARAGVPYGKNVPAWLELADGAYRFRAGARQTIRRIYEWSKAGLGISRILQRLESLGIPPFANAPRWSRSAVSELLAAREVIGEYQPCKGQMHRTPDGPPIPGYFPAAVTEKDWLEVQNAKRSRLKGSGRPAAGGKPSSPFSGLLRNALDGQKLRPSPSKHRMVLRSAGKIEGRTGSAACSFPLDHFCDGLLSQLSEVSAAALFADDGAGRVEELQGRLDGTKELMAVAVERFEKDRGARVWADRIDAYDKEIRATEEAIREAMQAAATPAAATWTEAIKLMRQNEPERLRQCLLSTIAEIWCVFVKAGKHKFAGVQVYFAGGAARREYLIASYVPVANATKKNRAKWSARSLSEEIDGGFDFRDREQAAALAAALAALPMP